MLKICKYCLVPKDESEFPFSSSKNKLNEKHRRVICRECKNLKNRNRSKNRSAEEKKLRRLNKKDSHLKARKNYKEKLKIKQLENEIESNKKLYSSILIDRNMGFSYYDLGIKYNTSIRFIKRLIKHQGNCYKKETVIDRIKPILDEYYNEQGIREFTFEWLRNSTGYKLKIDIFYIKSNIAVEFNGLQHYKEIGYGNLEEVKSRDQIKYKLLKEKGINLVIFTNEEDVVNLLEE